MTKAEVNTNCIGCGLCAELCPAVFELQDDGYAHVKVGEVKEENQEGAKEAESQCPVDAISVYNA
ncbi:MAG TPA: ferredoxin [Desulfobacteria bacterium]|nr:ferredoxin [Desulfobacteria bacterium]